MAKMTGFVFQDEYIERLAKLSDQEVGRLVRALAEYHATGKAQELAGRESIAFDFIKVDIDRIEQKYEAKCETNRNNRQRSSTNDNDRQQSSTIDDKVKVKDKYIDYNNNCAREVDYRHCEIGTLVSTCLKAMTPRAWDELKAYMGEMPEDLIAWAVQTSCEHGGNNWAYVNAVLRGLQSAGIKTVEDAEKRSEEHRKKRNQRQQKTGKPSNIAQLNYSQREYPEQKPGELPDWYIRMLEDEQKADAAKKAGVQPEMPEWLAEMMIEEATA